MPITTKVVNLNRVYDKVYSIHYVIKCVSDQRKKDKRRNNDDLCLMNRSKSSIFHQVYAISNYCLHTRWTSKPVNPRVVVFPRALAHEKENNFSRVDNLMFISYESKHCFLYRKYSKMFSNCNILFCRWQQHNFRDSKTLRNRIGINKENFNTFSVVRGCAPSDNLLSSSIL